jgi:lipopolysaccharide biosynthesis regulator YciM
MVNAQLPRTELSLDDEVSWDVIQLAASVALMGVASEKHEEAAQIADGLHAAFGQYVQVTLVAASVKASSGHLAEALSLLEDLAKHRPDIDATLSACAMLRKELGITGWRAMAKRVVQQGTDADAVRIAQELLAGDRGASERQVAVTGAANLRFA